MISVRIRISKLALAAALILIPARAQTPPKEPQWQNQAEYDMFSAVQKETDAHKKLSALDAWKQKFPHTEFQLQRLALYLNVYQQLNDFPKLIATLHAMLALNPKDLQVMSGIMFYLMQSQSPSAADLDNAASVANSVLANLDVQPAGVPAGELPAFRRNVEALAHTALGWVAMNRKNAQPAEEQFIQALKIDPNMGKVDLMLATALWTNKTPQNISKALFYYARAATYDGEGSPLELSARQQLDDFVRKAYTSYHGPDGAGLEALKRLARSRPFPPDDFEVLSAQQVAIQKEQELQKSNPQLALWLNLKRLLTAPDGLQYFESAMKGAEVPAGAGGVQAFKGTLISATPAVRSKELIVAIADPKTAEVTLKLDTPLPGKPEIGGQIEFEGVPTEFAAAPFHVTFEVERAKIKGLKLEAAPASRKKGGVRRRPS